MAGRFQDPENDLSQGEEAGDHLPDSRTEFRTEFRTESRSAASVGTLAERDIPAPRLARSITLFALSCFALIAVLNVLGTKPGPTKFLACLACVAVVFSLQLAHCSPGARLWSDQRKMWTLGTQALFTYLPFLFFGISWGGMAGCLAASVLLVVSGRTAWLLFSLIAVSVTIPPPLLGVPVVDTGYFTISTVLTGFVIYGLTRLTDLVHEVHAARSELARMAVVQERLRFARDLHDLLGYSLSAITLKAELTHRLVPANPTLAREEITSLLDISRQALADVRMVASGYRDMSLEAETASAQSILSAADIEAEVRIECGRLHPVVDTVLATALREGVTNILRHSKVEHCLITVSREGDTIRLTLVNDGICEPHPSPRSAHSGSGLGNLDARLREIGGRLTAGVHDDGRFHLVAESPAAPVRQDGSGASDAKAPVPKQPAA